MMKANLEQKILLKRCFFVIVIIILFVISSYFDFIFSLILFFILKLNLPYIFPYYSRTTLKYINTKVPLPDDILERYFLWKIFCFIYYSLMLPMLFLGKLENKSLTISILIFATPFLLIFFHGLIIFYRRLGGEHVDIEEKPRKTLLKNEQKNS